MIIFVDRVALLWRTFRRWRGTAKATKFEETIADHRRAVVEAVLAA